MNDRPPDFVTAVVDDDLCILQSLEGLLESVGHIVRVFDSADALLRSGSLADIDCLISDIDLPKMDGFELSRVAHTARPDLPIILMTAHYEMAEQARAFGLGHYQLFKKPFDAEELLTAVSVAVRHRRTSLSKSTAP